MLTANAAISDDFFNYLRDLGVVGCVQTGCASNMSNIKNLRTEHDELAVIGAHLSAIIEKNDPPLSHELYKIRMQFASALIRHLKSEDWILYPALLASSNKRIVVTARAFSASMGGLAENFKDYASRWNAGAIANDWSGYCRETAEILRVLMLRMKLEERDLYPFLDEVAQAAVQDYLGTRPEVTASPATARKQHPAKFSRVYLRPSPGDSEAGKTT
jgi:hypothetical protein